MGNSVCLLVVDGHDGLDQLDGSRKFGVGLLPKLSEAFYADAVRRVNLLTLAFALYFPTLERLRSTRSLA